jgi:hypothetical protein
VPCRHATYLDSRDVAHRRIRTCSRCGVRLPVVPVLMVGEANPYSPDPSLALHPDPPNAAGGRLMRLLGLPRLQYMAIARRNLCTTRWSAAEASLSGACIAGEVAAGKWRVVVCLGRRVAGTFYPGAPAWSVYSHGTCTFVLVPHPSGLCRVWNDPAARDRLCAFMVDLVPGPDWGTT